MVIFVVIPSYNLFLNNIIKYLIKIGRIGTYRIVSGRLVALKDVALHSVVSLEFHI